MIEEICGQELARARADVDRARAVLRDVEWSATEMVYWDSISVACCPSCGGIKPGSNKYDYTSVFGHLDDCRLIAALGPARAAELPSDEQVKT